MRPMSLALVALLVAAAHLPAGSASDHEMTEWSWSSAELEGAFAARTTLTFSAPTTCTIVVLIHVYVHEIQDDLFFGRDDGAAHFFEGRKDDPSGAARWSLPGHTHVHMGWATDDHAEIRVTNVATHEGTEPWLFVGHALAQEPGRTGPTFALSWTCDAPFTITLEAGREVAPYRPTLYCTNQEVGGFGVWGCPAALAVEERHAWEITAIRGVLRYHTDHDWGRVVLEGPGTSEEAIYAVPLDGWTTHRVSSGPGAYRATLTHAEIVPLWASGWMVGVSPVASLDEWPDLPRL